MLRNVVLPRLRIWREVVWRPWIAVLAAAYCVLQFYQWFKGEWLSPEAQERWRLPNILPSLPWWYWLVGWLLFFVAVALEGAYRSVLERDTALAEKERIALAQAALNPALEVVFDEKCEQCFDESGKHVNVGIWNIGHTAENVRAYLSSLEPGPVFGKLQLPWVGEGRVGLQIHKSIRSGHHHAQFMLGDITGPYEFVVNTEAGALNGALSSRQEYVAKVLVEGSGVSPVIVKVIVDPNREPLIVRVSSNVA